MPSGPPATLGAAGMSANESLESLWALRCLSQGGRALQDENSPFRPWIRTFHVMDRGLRNTQKALIVANHFLETELEKAEGCGLVGLCARHTAA